MLSTSPKQDKQLVGLIHSPIMIALANLNADIIACTRCPRLVAYREAVAQQKKRQYREWPYWGKPIPGFGDPRARLYILGLAPAAHGGNRTGRIFTGDRSGDWLYEALHRFGYSNQETSTHVDDGLILTDCYIGATVRCAPPANKPTLDEFTACRPFVLGEFQELREVRVVVALGKIAFDHYLKAVCEMGMERPRPLPRFAHGATHHMPSGVTLIGSYHPSQQNTFTGKLTRPMFHRIFLQATRCLSTSQSND
jgi:uracil-DNA glycosylase